MKRFLKQLTPPVLWSVLSKAAAFYASRKPNDFVLRSVRGVSLLMDRHHALPSFAENLPLYDTALPALASFLHGRTSRQLVMVDVGANIGDTACLTAAKVGPENIKIVCVEAEDLYLPLLRHNTAHLNAEIIHAIAGPVSGLAEKRTLPSGRGSSVIVSDSVKRKMISIDDLNLEHVDIFKSDTDGFELEVLKGASATLQNNTDVVFIEFSPSHLRDYGRCEPGEILDFLATHGFSSALVYDNFGIPMGVHANNNLRAVCDYVDLQRNIYLDLLFCRDERMLIDFMDVERDRAKAALITPT